MLKEIVTQENLINVLNLIESLNIKYWLDGGWGVDVLVGRQTRSHRDVDIDYDIQYTEKLLNALLSSGYKITTDLRPTRIELYHSEFGYIDIHPFILCDDGTAKQSDLEGGLYKFESDYFGYAVFLGKHIPCISPKGQKIFHTGYNLRDVDLHDIKNIETLFK